MLNKLFITLLSFILVGCMSFSSTEDEQPLELGDRTVNYKSGDNVISLTVPPDLTKPKITDVVPLPDSDNPESNKILVTPTDISVIRKGQRRWLEVNKTPEDMWNIAKDFFKEYGFAIDKSNKKIGLIETDSLPRVIKSLIRLWGLFAPCYRAHLKLNTHCRLLTNIELELNL
jgi:outer membrane protein assembly factor BamC